MPRSRRALAPAPSARRGIRDRHGRGLRSSVAGPYLPMLRGRIELFDTTIASTAEYLRGLWPGELSAMTIEIASAPHDALHGDHVDRWTVRPHDNRIVFYRVPIQRLSKLHRNDEVHQRLMVESCVFRAVAELLGKDPWDLAPERFRHF
ncbi:metallopeptidase family protein [Luethyella okanaganae]|uniref:Metallopeptidase family protein n=1 Tax=Luethyella okanaganae TaxID=69372 RepID=A0ABW1V9V4_9MICO